MSTTYYGFNVANNAEQPAWFHTPEAALRFANACGWTTGEDQRKLTVADLDSTTEASPSDIMDTPTEPWTAQS